MSIKFWEQSAVSCVEVNSRTAYVQYYLAVAKSEVMNTEFLEEVKCYHMRVHELEKINLVYILTGTACSVVLLAITLLLLFCKQFETLLKRLILYTSVATTLRLLTLTTIYK